MRYPVVPVLIVVLAFTGCTSDKPPKGQIDGQVLIDGKPVTFGQVVVHSRERGIGAIATIQPTGSYSFDTPLDAGDYEVYVRPVPPEPGGPSTENPDIPQRYRNLATSGLKINVIGGKNDYRIEMTRN